MTSRIAWILSLAVFVMVGCGRKAASSPPAAASPPSPTWIVWERPAERDTTVIDLRNSYRDTDGRRAWMGTQFAPMVNPGPDDKPTALLHWQYVGKTDKFGEAWLVALDVEGTRRCQTCVSLERGNHTIFEDDAHRVRLSVSKP